MEKGFVKCFPKCLMEIIWRSIGQETLQMAEAQPTLIKVQRKCFTNVKIPLKVCKINKAGKTWRVDFRTAAIRSGGSVLEWTLTGTSASSGEEKVGVKYIFCYNYFYCSVEINKCALHLFGADPLVYR